MKPSLNVLALVNARPDTRERLMKGAVVNPVTGCWERSGAAQRGYTRLGFGKSNSGGAHPLAHRLMWAVENGSDPGDMMVCHTCDNRRCINPEHLFLGTALDNAQDMARKGRRVTQTAPRVRKRGSKLTLADVEAIRTASGTNREIADAYSLSLTHVWSIRTGRIWTAEARAKRRAERPKRVLPAIDAPALHSSADTYERQRNHVTR